MKGSMVKQLIFIGILLFTPPSFGMFFKNTKTLIQKDPDHEDSLKLKTARRYSTVPIIGSFLAHQQLYNTDEMAKEIKKADEKEKQETAKRADRALALMHAQMDAHDELSEQHMNSIKEKEKRKAEKPPTERTPLFVKNKNN